MITRIGGVTDTIQAGPDFAGRVSRETSRHQGPGAGVGGGDAPAARGRTFADLLNGTIEEVNRHQHDADQAIRELIAGRTKNVHETMLAIERADASLKLMVQVRNKLLDAYREIMRMQV